MVRKHKKGFTLVELLAVIVILAIILVIAVPQIMKTIDEARKGALGSSAKLIAASAEREYLARKTIGDTDFNPANVVMECSEVAETTSDYTDCSIKFDANGKATVKLKGQGKFKGKYVCAGTREEAVVTEEECGLVALTVDPNGGTNTEEYNAKYESGSTVTLVVPTAPEGKEFDSWEVIVGADKGASVTGNTLTMGTEATTVKAIWKDINYLERHDWATIVAAVSDGTYPSEYTVGSTKTIDLDINGDGTNETYTLRVANATACETEWMNDTTKSQTACGFVLEFVEVIRNRVMNSNGSNAGGWPASEIRLDLQREILPKIEAVIGTNTIKTTRVISSYEGGKNANYSSDDKLYLLSPQEVWGTSFTEQYDKSIGTSKQLKYYEDNNVTTASPNRKGAIKNNLSGTESEWWLRSACYNRRNRFYRVGTYDTYDTYEANYFFGVSPAFRIG